ncbi:alpha/beta fold hydrolase [Ulvibacterium sp.]|uniref:alpha/beta fold hydrolase n=1 Tax=Ulvibacterium sp. TaxID=2665914 RepID=UPI003CC58DDB
MKRKLKIALIVVTTIILLLPIFGYVYLFLLPISASSLSVSSQISDGNTMVKSGMKTDNKLILKDGRTLGYAEYGDPVGFPIFYFHGGQESRLSSAFMHSTAQNMGIRIIAPDRPGIGLSSFKKNRTFLDWPMDVTELADYLQLKKFSVFGLSGGSPHVLACAYEIPNRICKSAVVCGAAPYDYKGSLKGMWPPVQFIHWLASRKNDNGLRKVIQNDIETLLKKPESRLKQFQNYLPVPDREIMTQRPEYGWEFIDGSVEAYKNGIDGVVQEWKLYVNDWGFRIKDIDAPIQLWYGAEDKMSPFHRGTYLDSELINSKLHVLENEGHFSLIRNHLEKILHELKGTLPME